MFDLEGLDEWMEGRDMFAVIEVEGGEFHIIVVEGSVYGGEVIDVRSRDLTHLAAQLALEQAAWDKKQGKGGAV